MGELYGFPHRIPLSIEEPQTTFIVSAACFHAEQVARLGYVPEPNGTKPQSLFPQQL